MCIRDSLEVVMRSIIYAAYSQDLSVKTTSAKVQMMKQGKYVGGYAPYGYVLHPTIRSEERRVGKECRL